VRPSAKDFKVILKETGNTILSQTGHRCRRTAAYPTSGNKASSTSARSVEAVTKPCGTMLIDQSTLEEYVQNVLERAWKDFYAGYKGPLRGSTHFMQGDWSIKAPCTGSWPCGQGISRNSPPMFHIAVTPDNTNLNQFLATSFASLIIDEAKAQWLSAHESKL